MAYPISYKAQELASEIVDRLKQRFASLTVTLSSDTDQYPLISVGALTAGSQSFVIKIAPVDWSQAVDIFGNAAEAFGPHRAQVVLETSTIANVPLLTGANVLLMLGEAALWGTSLELYLTANGTPPSSAGIASANLKQTFYPQLYRPYLLQQ